MCSSLPKISLVTPSYNQAHYLPQTIQSVLGQNYPHLEYFVIDDGSTDHSCQTIESYADQLTDWVRQKNSGQASAVNQGFTRTTGEIMGWLNSDDILWEGSLNTIGTYFATHPDVSVLCGWSLFFRSQRIWYLHEPIGLHLEYLLFSTYFLPQESVFWRRQVYEEIGGLDENCHLLPDLDYFIRMALLGARSATLRRPIGGFRQHEQQKTANKQMLARHQYCIRNYYIEKLGITPRQAQRQRRYWQRRVQIERAFRKLRRLIFERCKVRQVLNDCEAYLAVIKTTV